VNDPLPFISFIAGHRLGEQLEGEVEGYTSHGAVVRVGEMRCYVPLANLGDPAPRSAREVLKRHQTGNFVLTALDPQRRGAELALPGIALVSGHPRAETVAAEVRLARPPWKRADGSGSKTVGRAKKAPAAQVPAKAVPEKAAARKATGNKAAAEKAAAGKAVPEKSAAEKAAAGKAAGKKAAGKKTVPEKAAARKVAAKKVPPARQAAPARTPEKARRAPGRHRARAGTARRCRALAGGRGSNSVCARAGRLRAASDTDSPKVPADHGERERERNLAQRPWSPRHWLIFGPASARVSSVGLRNADDLDRGAHPAQGSVSSRLRDRGDDPGGLSAWSLASHW